MPDFSSLREQTTKEDAFAHHILDREVLRPANAATQPIETQKQTDEWSTLCRAKGWLCGVCGAYPEYGSSLGYEDGLCPAHRLTSHAE